MINAEPADSSRIPIGTLIPVTKTLIRAIARQNGLTCLLGAGRSRREFLFPFRESWVDRKWAGYRAIG
jgi:hypothetical protein